MLRNSKIVLAAAFIFGAASLSLAQGARLPTLDLHKLCAQNDSAVRAVITDVSGNFVSTRMADEQSAREELEKQWRLEMTKEANQWPCQWLPRLTSI